MNPMRKWGKKMTKKEMIETIQNEETKRWKEIQWWDKYRNNRDEVGEEMYRRKLTKWVFLTDIMKMVDIETELMIEYNKIK